MRRQRTNEPSRDADGRILDTNGEPLQAGAPCEACGRVTMWDAGTEQPTECRHCGGAIASVGGGRR